MLRRRPCSNQSPAGPTAANLPHAAAGGTDKRTDRQTDGHRTVTQTLLRILCGHCQYCAENPRTPLYGAVVLFASNSSVLYNIKKLFRYQKKTKKTVIKNNRTSVRAARRVGRRVGLTIDSRSARSHVLCRDSGQVVHTVVPLSPSGMIWTVTLCSCEGKTVGTSGIQMAVLTDFVVISRLTGSRLMNGR